jgi:SAM-dependent methyltransferase
MDMEYVKHFNQQSENYLTYRPTYPAALFDFLETLLPQQGVVWDCGTGTGQAALALAQRNFYVLATDVNPAPLIIGSTTANGVHYICCSAETTCFDDHTIHLITIAQALHWFDFAKFYVEVRRVSAQGSYIVAWCYSLGKINPQIDKIVSKLYYDILGEKYWPKERRYIDEGYRTIPFPFAKIKPPNLNIEKKLTLESFLGYLNTWSAVKEYEQKNHKNPIDFIALELKAAWGDGKEELCIIWPIHLLAGRVE